jgi:hypothetical protein
VTDLGAPLPASVRELIAAEEAAPPGGDRAAIRGRVLASVGIAAAATAATTSTSAASTAGVVTGKLIAFVLVVGAIGGGVAVVARRNSDVRPAAPRVEPPVPRAVVPAPPAPPAVAPSVSPPVESTTAQALAAPAPVVVPAKPSPRKPTPESSAPSQRALLADAWAALGRGEHETALSIVERDARLHPGGALAEEREALRIDILLRLGRTGDAGIRARAFADRYPDSLHHALVERAIHEAP